MITWMVVNSCLLGGPYALAFTECAVWGINIRRTTGQFESFEPSIGQTLLLPHLDALDPHLRVDERTAKERFCDILKYKYPITQRNINKHLQSAALGQSHGFCKQFCWPVGLQWLQCCQAKKKRW